MNSDKTGREYATKDISNIVGIAPPTVRKYSQALEKAGYSFIKNENGFRIYFDKDIFAFNEIKSMSKKSGMPVEKIAEMIVFNQRQEIQHEATADTVEIIHSESENTSDIVQYDSRYNELMEKLSKLDMLDEIVKEMQELKADNKALAEQMKQQQEYIDKSLERRDKALLQAIRESQQAKLETAATKKEGFFKRLFGKK
ncbi:DUF3967 domain-containing protein [Heyndrickxia ginsengihumi]|uniref:DUF3967 domain-containing protein n=1 Tax=Heyndrickxia ginsengihumi TaxID=363870 RepID=UPI003D20922D